MLADSQAMTAAATGPGPFLGIHGTFPGLENIQHPGGHGRAVARVDAQNIRRRAGPNAGTTGRAGIDDAPHLIVQSVDKVVRCRHGPTFEAKR